MDQLIFAVESNVVPPNHRHIVQLFYILYFIIFRKKKKSHRFISIAKCEIAYFINRSILTGFWSANRKSQQAFLTWLPSTRLCSALFIILFSLYYIKFTFCPCSQVCTLYYIVCVIFLCGLLFLLFCPFIYRFVFSF